MPENENENQGYLNSELGNSIAANVKHLVTVKVGLPVRC
jgi:hypothetical protein